MINEYNNYVEIKTKKGVERMTLEEFSRWACLVEAVGAIQKNCEDRGVEMDDVNWIKPIAIQKYIDERFHSMLHDVTVEVQQGKI